MKRKPLGPSVEAGSQISVERRRPLVVTAAKELYVFMWGFGWGCVADRCAAGAACGCSWLICPLLTA